MRKSVRNLLILLLFVLILGSAIGIYFFLTEGEDADIEVADEPLGRVDGVCRVGLYANHYDAINRLRDENVYISQNLMEQTVAELEADYGIDIEYQFYSGNVANNAWDQTDILFVTDSNEGHLIGPDGNLKNRGIPDAVKAQIERQWFNQMNLSIVGESSQARYQKDQGGNPSFPLDGDLANGVTASLVNYLFRDSQAITYDINSTTSWGWTPNLAEYLTDPNAPDFLQNAWIWTALSQSPGIINLNPTGNGEQCYKTMPLFGVQPYTDANGVYQQSYDPNDPAGREACAFVYVPDGAYNSFSTVQDNGFLTLDGIVGPTRSKLKDLVLSNEDCMPEDEPEIITCFTCTTSLEDGDACVPQQFLSSEYPTCSDVGPEWTSDPEGCAAVATGGVCPARVPEDPTIIKNNTSQATGGEETIVDYELIVTNQDSDAVSVDVEDVLPDGVSVVDGSISNAGVFANGVINWTDIALPPLESVTLTYQLIIPSSLYGQNLENIATVFVNDEPKDDDDSTVLINLPDINKDGQVIDVDSNGAQIEYTIDVNNNSEEEQPNISITDTLPDGVVSVENLTDGGVYDSGTNTITWDNLTIPPRSTDPNVSELVLTYLVNYDDSVFGTTLINTATLFLGDDPIDEDPHEEPVDGDLAATINKSHQITKLENSVQVDYTLSANNIGDTDLVDYSIEDTLDSMVMQDWVSNISDGGTLANGVISWTDVDIPVGGSITRTYTVTIPLDNPGSYENVVVIQDSNGVDVDDDDDTVNVEPDPTPDPVNDPVSDPKPTPGGTTGSQTPSKGGPLPDTSMPSSVLIVFIGLAFTAVGLMIYRLNLATSFIDDKIINVIRSSFIRSVFPYDKGVETRIDKNLRRNK